MSALYRFVTASLIALVLAGCAPEVVPSSGPRAPTVAERVKIYEKQPARYEQLATIELPITPENSWDEKADANVAFDTMRTKAAAAGANGLLLVANIGSFDYLVTAGYHGTFYQVPVKLNPRTAVVQAIYVLKE